MMLVCIRAKWLQLWNQSGLLLYLTFCSTVYNELLNSYKRESSWSSGVGWSWGDRTKGLIRQSVLTTFWKSVNNIMTRPLFFPPFPPFLHLLWISASMQSQTWVMSISHSWRKWKNDISFNCEIDNAEDCVSPPWRDTQSHLKHLAISAITWKLYFVLANLVIGLKSMQSFIFVLDQWIQYSLNINFQCRCDH